MFGEFGRPPDDVVPRDDIVDGPVGEGLRGRERLTFEDGNQADRLVGSGLSLVGDADVIAEAVLEVETRLGDECFDAGRACEEAR